MDYAQKSERILAAREFLALPKLKIASEMAYKVQTLSTITGGENVQC